MNLITLTKAKKYFTSRSLYVAQFTQSQAPMGPEIEVTECTNFIKVTTQLCMLLVPGAGTFEMQLFLSLCLLVTHRQSRG